MRRRALQLMGVATVFLTVILLLKLAGVPIAGQAPEPTATAGTTATSGTAAATGPAAETPWGEPDLQGIWTDVYQTPLQRSPKYAGKESFTDEERAALDAQRAEIELRPRQERGTR